ncbi:MAG TPA: FAD-dependent thymidylate synthase [Anaerolineales bacterium]|nr:FAD-dependent thymidylate synthase [Anaerolineales bacterium]
MPDRQIYLLSPKQLSPETIAVAFAKTSRSPESFLEIAAGLTEEKSAQFHEKWVVGYGHASVAEHAVLHIAFENVSRLTIESIESNRLASYTEKSTRYQKWGRDDFFIPAELDGHALREDYIAACRLLFATYASSLDPVRTLILQRAQRRENESDEALDRRLRSQYVDVCRFLLPAASLANVGMTANARVLENVIRKMLSHELAEVREIGEQVKAVAKSEIPTLVKYADAVPYLVETPSQLAEFSQKMGAEMESRQGEDWCQLVDYDKDGENKILAAALYRFGGMSYPDAYMRVKSLPDAMRAGLAEAFLGKLDKHDVPLRELEYSIYTFDLVMDQGAYAEFKRHRMMTQTPQMLTTWLGYATPRLITEAGFGSEYQAAMKSAGELFEKLYEFNPRLAQYIVPNGFNRRVLAQFNLREAFAFCQLRSAPNAHFSIRRVAQKIYEELLRVHPLLTKYIRLSEETWQGVEQNHFTLVSSVS